MGLMTKGTFGDYLDTVSAERRYDFDSPVSLEDVVLLQRSISNSNRPFPELAAFVPPGWERRPLLSGLDNPSYTKRSLLELSGTRLYSQRILVRASVYLVPAGGAVRQWLYEDPTDDFAFSSDTTTGGGVVPNDLDYFVVAETESDYETMKSAPNKYMAHVADVLLEKAKNVFSREVQPGSKFTYTLCRGVVTLTLRVEGRAVKRTQIILRGPYKTAGAVISGFDLPASSVYITVADDAEEDRGAFEHKFTTGGAYTAATGLQIIDTACRSTTFASRIAKYMARGVGIVLPEISPDKVHAALKEHPEGFALDTLDYRLHILPADDQKRTEPNMWRCQIELLGGPNQKRMGGSDYDPEGERPGHTYPNTWHASAVIRAVRTLGREDTSQQFRFYIHSCIRVPSNYIYFPRTIGEHLENIEHVLEREGHTIRTWLKSLAPTRTSGYQIRKIKTSDFLLDVLGIPPERLEEIYTEVKEALRGRSYNTNTVDFSSTIMPYIDSAIANMQKHASEPIEMWVRLDPQRQWWTASLNPAVVDATEYYSQFYREVDRSILARGGTCDCVTSDDPEHLETRVVQADYCPLCLTKIYPGAKNTITLPCGHTMCYMINAECGGWCSVRGDKCPVCRTEVTEYIVAMLPAVVSNPTVQYL